MYTVETRSSPLFGFSSIDPPAGGLMYMWSPEFICFSVSSPWFSHVFTWEFQLPLLAHLFIGRVSMVTYLSFGSCGVFKLPMFYMGCLLGGLWGFV